jgi:methionyl-tRNA formyltransferase
MRIIFAGTPAFAAESLQALIDAKHEVVAVYTQPDRPAGRGRKLTPSPVKSIALAHNIDVEQPLNFKAEENREKLASYHADLMIVVAYGLLLPQSVLDIPKLGCINVHASLLPRWRGAAPIQRAILAGDEETGIGIMQMEAGLDTGPVLLEARCPILQDDTTASLHDRLADLGAKTLIESLKDIASLIANAQPQDDAAMSYAKKITKSEALIEWTSLAEEIDRQIRAFNPWPIAQTQWQNQIMRIWSARQIESNTSANPGTVIAVSPEGIDVATGKNALRITELQLPGKRAMSTQDFLNANTLEVGTQLG